jgi:flagellar FliL protein
MAEVEKSILVEEPKKQKSKLKLLLIGLFIVVAGAAGFFGWRYFGGSPAKPSAAEQAEPALSETSESETDHDGKSAEDGDTGTNGAIVNFEPFLVNLADRDAFRYLRVTIRLQVLNKTAAAKIASTDVFSSQIRDTVLGTLATKVSDEIITPEGKDKLKREIADKLNTFLPGKPVKAVFFTDFVVQL